MPETLQEAVDRLAAFATVDEIDKYLREGGYVEGALWGSAFHCPVARYLDDKLGLSMTPGISGECVGVNGSLASHFFAVGSGIDNEIVSLPQNVRDWIGRFDVQGVRDS